MSDFDHYVGTRAVSDQHLFDTAALSTWLASPDAAAVTGEAYNISGGEFFA